MSGKQTMTRVGAPRWPAGALVGLATGAGLLVALRAIAALDADGLTSLLTLEAIPRESFGIEWSARAAWPVDAQRAAWDSLVGTVAALFLASIALAALNAVILLAEGSAARRGELAVRSALGATPWTLTQCLLAEIRTLVVAGSGLGIVAGLAGGLAARIAWPHGLSPVLARPPLELIAALTVLIALCGAAHLGGVRRAVRHGRAADDLRAGARVSADPMAVFVRKALAASHVSVAATVLAMALALSEGRSGGTDAGADGAPETVVLGLTEPATGWAAAFRALREVPGLEAESLAAPGALVGLGVRDIAITECGACVRGGLPTPLWSAIADHHVVGPSYFDLVGIELIEGRDFGHDDDEASEPVAIVNRTFAYTSFEGGRPIGKRIRIGTDFGSWYRVVGVVDNQSARGLGTDGVQREAVYVSALQRPPGTGYIVLMGRDDAIAAATLALDAAGYAPTRPEPVTAFRARAGGAVSWARMVAVALAMFALLLATHGTYLVAVQTTRRRRGALAVRRAVGASSWRIVSYVLAERLRVTAWGLAGFAFFGTLALALLKGSTGLQGPGPSGYVLVAGGLATVALMASARAAGEALAVEPTRLLD